MKYYLIAGEASGDLHASNLMKALQEEDPQASFRYWGGDQMEAVGGQLVKHYRELAFMGLIEVLKNLPTIARNMRFCKEDISTFRPDVLILIDYSGFNLRIAKWAKQVGQKVFYYIAPQVWASRPKRVYVLKETVDELFAIFPFEEAFYAQYKMPVHYVGHPLLDVIHQYSFQANFIEQNNLQVPYIALLPGSRKQEIRSVLKVLLQTAKQFTDYTFVIAVAPAIPLPFYETLIQEIGMDKMAIRLIEGATYDIIKNAQAAIVTSGTATLETALLGTPQVVVYKGNAFTYQIARRMITVPYISLVNLILDRTLVQELVQHELTVQRLTEALKSILRKDQAQRMKESYRMIRKKLGEVGASKRAAKQIVRLLR